MDARLVITTAVLLASVGSAEAAAYKPPRDGFGHPDLSGTWTNTTVTPMERPAAFGARRVMTEAEVASVEGARAALLANGARPTDPGATVQDVNKTCDLPGVPATADCAYNVSWFDAGETVMRVNGEPRASLITFPANGRIPYAPGRSRPREDRETADNPENRSLSERCLVSRNIAVGAVLNPTLYNNTYVVAQSGDAVAVVFEMSHDARTVRIGADHGPPQWFGDSVGRWEGDALVVETIGFHPDQLAFNSDRLKVTERFTRTAADRLLYQFRVEDPVAYAEPWGGEYEFRTSAGPQYEFACHEGNHGLSGILAGARAGEKSH